MKKYLYLNSDNFASVLNSSNNAMQYVGELCNNVLNEGKVITEMTLKQQQDKTTIEEVRRNAEVVSIPLEIAKNLFGSFYDYSILENKKFKENSQHIAENVKSYFGIINEVKIKENIKNDDKANEYIDNLKSNYKQAENYNATCLDDKDKWQNILGLTKEKVDRIKGVGKYEGMEFCSYEIGQGSLKEVELDMQIIEKFMNCNIKNESGEYVFKDLLVLDGSGTVFLPKKLGFFEASIIKNFAGQTNSPNKPMIQYLMDMNDHKLRNRHNKHGAKLRFLSRVSGMKEMDEQLNQYTSQITKPIHLLKSAKKGSEFVVGGMFGFSTSLFNSKKKIQIISKSLELAKLKKKLDLITLSNDKIIEIIKKFKYKSISNDKLIELTKKLELKSISTKEKDEIKKQIEKLINEERAKIIKEITKVEGQLKELNELLNKRIKKQVEFGQISHKIYNPTETTKNATKKGLTKVVNKIKNSKDVKKIVNSKAGKVAKSLSEKMKTPFKLIKKFRDGVKTKIGGVLFENPLSKLLRKIFGAALNVVKIAVMPLIILIVIVFAIGLIGEGGANENGVITIMPLSNNQDFKDYQNLYNSYDDGFMKYLEKFVQNKAVNTNLKGEKIYYGVNGMNNEEGMKNNDYQNGLYYKYIVDDAHLGRSSNIEDLIAMMAIIMGQSQSAHKEISEQVLKWLYNLSHIYTYQESPLYACDSACHKIDYHCVDHFHLYEDTDIRYTPFHAVRKSGDDYEVLKAKDYCEVCGQFFDNSEEIPKFKEIGHSTDCIVATKENPVPEDYWGCIPYGTCSHGTDGYIGRGRHCSYCSSYNIIPDCKHVCGNACERNGCIHTCGDNCYYMECRGHNHYTCNGHEYKCCMGHIDIQMDIKIKFFEELKDTINKYDFGKNDYIAKQLNQEE